MDDMDDLASAAKQAWRRPYQQPKSNSKPVVITVIVIGALLIGFGAIVWLARPTPPSPAGPPAVVETDPITPEMKAEAAEVAKDKAAHMQFNTFTSRLAGLLGKSQQLHLQAAAGKDKTYTCSYVVRKTKIERGKDARSPRQCLITLTGNVDWNDEENNTSAETYKITATFADNDGAWTIVNATSELLTHKDSAGLFGDVVRIGSTKNLASIDWFNEAVTDAQKTGS